MSTEVEHQLAADLFDEILARVPVHTQRLEIEIASVVANLVLSGQVQAERVTDVAQALATAMLDEEDAGAELRTVLPPLPLSRRMSDREWRRRVHITRARWAATRRGPGASCGTRSRAGALRPRRTRRRRQSTCQARAPDDGRPRPRACQPFQSSDRRFKPAVSAHIDEAAE